ncbi:MAG: TIGR03000 domain-containing protein [Gemmataceae bacterium]|nr:TIGR03000 domain-containing protein [Gemmataceae bacterium]
MAVPLVGGVAWPRQPYPPYPPQANPWGWGAGGVYSPSPGAPPMKRLEESLPDPKADVAIIVPDGTRVRVNGAEVAVKGRQEFRTPEPLPGQKYHYLIEADVRRGGRMATETQRVAIEAGKSVAVDFTR